MDADDLDSAISLLEESATTDPHFKTLELLGECFLRRKQHRKAVIPLAASVGLGAKPYRALYLLAQALDGLGSRRDAIEKLSEAIEMKPDYKSARDLLETLRASSTDSR
jgi:tetratricopeptide (TPR) repeat protein